MQAATARHVMPKNEKTRTGSATARVRDPKTSKHWTLASMTEYQTRFMPPPCCAVTTTSTKENSYNALKGMNADLTTFTSCTIYKPQPPRDQKKSTKTAQPDNWFGGSESSKMDYTTVYKDDFPQWQVTRSQPFKPHDSLKVSHGLVVPETASENGRSQKKHTKTGENSNKVVRQPFEGITSYSSDFVRHPEQPRAQRRKPATQTNKSHPVENKASIGQMNQNPSDGASKFWSVEIKFQGQNVQ